MDMNEFETLNASLEPLWDVIVVGAGTAGALTAHQLAARGLRVLMVDKAAFPRYKVCGCSLNLKSMDALEQAGLGSLVAEQGGAPLTGFRGSWRGVQTRMDLPGGWVLSRSKLDTALAKAAMARGARFICCTAAALGPLAGDARTVVLTGNGLEKTVRAKTVVAADGLGARFVRREPVFQRTQRSDSHIGVAAVGDAAPESYESGVIYMACGPDGYVGLLRLEDGRPNMAAALAPDAVRKKGPAACVKELLDESGFGVISGLDALAWKGTPPLTQSVEPVAAQRVFLVGDAAGYLEPFTGEGMTWALQGAVAIAPCVAESLNDAGRGEEAWIRRYRAAIVSEQGRCKLVTAAVRRPWLMKVAAPLLAWLPVLAQPIVNGINDIP